MCNLVHFIPRTHCIIPIYQRKKLRFRNIEVLDQSYTAYQLQSWDMSSGLIVIKFEQSNTLSLCPSI